MKIHYTEKAWHRAAVEDPRNPSFTIIEIELSQSGDTLIIGEEEYSDVEDALNECETWSDGGCFYELNPKDVLDCVTIYKSVDSSNRA